MWQLPHSACHFARGEVLGELPCADAVAVASRNVSVMRCLISFLHVIALFWNMALSVIFDLSMCLLPSPEVRDA